MIRKIMFVFAMVLIFSQTYAKEGMWIPLLLEKQNIADMQERGFRLTAEDIYSINESSMKDAVVIFGGGCTGELISDKGLLMTNHHCGYSAIQKHSSVENDYLTHGFWAMSQAEELPNEKLTVTFLRRMEDVTDSVLKDADESLSMAQRNKIITSNMDKIIKSSTEETHFSALVEPFFHGNQYFLFIYEDFTDVRLVGAPPSAIGKFGGDVDNWMWPRHTGDFSLFRIYTDADNQPADFTPENVPYQPKHHFPISLKGVEEGDFTMIFGYPGSTAQYVPSFHIEMLTEILYPQLIDVRTQKLNVYRHYMEMDAATRIQYASKSASVSNAWKRWRGEIRGLEILDAVHKKQKEEEDFQKWLMAQQDREMKWGTLLSNYKEVYSHFSEYNLARNLMLELIGRNGLEMVQLAGHYGALVSLLDQKEVDEIKISEAVQELQDRTNSHFKDYSNFIDSEVSPELLIAFRDNSSKEFHPSVYQQINSKYKGDVHAYMKMVFNKSVFSNEKQLNSLLNNPTQKNFRKLKKDPAYLLYGELAEIYYGKISEGYRTYSAQLDSLNRIYMQALMAFDSTKNFYPDANFTLRVGYGQVKGYKARDAVHYDYYTTLDGIMEKNDPDIYDYRVPERLKELYESKDYGRYEVNGTVPVCFVATNHTTGGNSGSPIINANGELIGVNFDRAWEGVMSDLMFNPDQCRNISIDIRYALFIIDKFAGAGYLLDEMSLVH
ncbi:MAG TPA: S46 family peptidase [Marinilabiliaceae bacterium]|nr:S46 family peptidase [Marinilabiliaceae bacterium]